MKLRGRKLGFLIVAALTLVQVVAISPAVAATAPVAPAQPKVTLGNAQARVNWVAPATNGSAITGYVVTPFVGAVAQAARVFNMPGLAENVTGLAQFFVLDASGNKITPPGP